MHHDKALYKFTLLYFTVLYFVTRLLISTAAAKIPPITAELGLPTQKFRPSLLWFLQRWKSAKFVLDHSTPLALETLLFRNEATYRYQTIGCSDDGAYILYKSGADMSTPSKSRSSPLENGKKKCVTSAITQSYVDRLRGIWHAGAMVSGAIDCIVKMHFWSKPRLPTAGLSAKFEFEFQLHSPLSRPRPYLCRSIWLGLCSDDIHCHTFVHVCCLSSVLNPPPPAEKREVKFGK